LSCRDSDDTTLRNAERHALSRLGTRDDVETQREYYRDIRAACERALRSVNWMMVADETSWGNLWLILDIDLDKIAQTAAAQVVPQ
jgi:hypothetical protein